MAKALDPKELTDLRELVMSLVWSEEALVTLLEEKGVLTRGEVPAKIKEPQEAQVERVATASKGDGGQE